jgi:hypothetical protein
MKGKRQVRQLVERNLLHLCELHHEELDQIGGGVGRGDPERLEEGDWRQEFVRAAEGQD